MSAGKSPNNAFNLHKLRMKGVFHDLTSFNTQNLNFVQYPDHNIMPHKVRGVIDPYLTFSPETGRIYGHMMDVEENIYGIMKIVYRESFIPKTRLQSNIRLIREYYTGDSSIHIGTMK